MGLRLEDDGYCFVCGTDNPLSLNVEFRKTDTGASAEFIGEKRHQGYKNIVHGGIIAALLDEISIKSLFIRGVKAVTAEMNTRFRQPLFVGEKALLFSHIVRVRGKLYEVDAEMKKTNGEIIAQCRAKLLEYGE